MIWLAKSCKVGIFCAFKPAETACSRSSTTAISLRWLHLWGAVRHGEVLLVEVSDGRWLAHRVVKQGPRWQTCFFNQGRCLSLSGWLVWVRGYPWSCAGRGTWQPAYPINYHLSAMASQDVVAIAPWVSKFPGSRNGYANMSGACCWGVDYRTKLLFWEGDLCSNPGFAA